MKIRRTIPGGIAVLAVFTQVAVSYGGDWAFEVGINYDLVHPKARVRDGVPALAGDNIFTGPTMGLDSEVPSATLWLVVNTVRDRFLVSGWRGGAKGESVLKDDIAYCGRTIPEGTALESEERWSSVRVQYMRSFRLASDANGRTWLSANVGAAIDRTTFRAELDWGGDGDDTYLTGVFPTVQAGVDVEPLRWLSVRAEMGGFHLPTVPNGDTAVIAPVEYRLALKGDWRRFSATAGYYLFHVHFERDRDTHEEDVVHLRLRSTYIGVGYSF